MTTTDRLHCLADALPADATDTAVRVLEALVAQSLTWAPVALACALAPGDDEPVTDADRAALTERSRTDQSAYVPLDAALAQFDAGAADGHDARKRAIG